MIRREIWTILLLLALSLQFGVGQNAAEKSAHTRLVAYQAQLTDELDAMKNRVGQNYNDYCEGYCKDNSLDRRHQRAKVEQERQAWEARAATMDRDIDSHAGNHPNEEVLKVRSIVENGRKYLQEMTAKDCSCSSDWGVLPYILGAIVLALLLCLLPLLYAFKKKVWCFAKKNPSRQQRPSAEQAVVVERTTHHYQQVDNHHASEPTAIRVGENKRHM